MASVSVVGQHAGPHRLDPEPPLLVFKLASARKKIPLPRKSSMEKMVFRRSAVTGDCTPGTPGVSSDSAAPEKQLLIPMPPERPTETGTEGCAVLPAQAPRSPESGRQEGTHCDGPMMQGMGERLNGQVIDWNRNADSDSNQNTAGRREADMPSILTANRQKGAPAHRDLPSGRLSGQPVSLPGGLPIDRLTQGRTGVVKLARAEPSRREAWSIFPSELDPRVRSEKGEGHRFGAKTVTQDWCDVCSRRITAQALKCHNCSYTCHLDCEARIRLDCNQKDRRPEETQSPRSQCSTASQQKNDAKEEEQEGRSKALSEAEVRARIEEYNAQVSENGMNLAQDGTYTGFIKVHFRLSRPITVPVMEGAGSEGGYTLLAAGDGEEEPSGVPSDRRTSFYLPSDCVKALHISSRNTAKEVIQGLLRKFMVLDNPRKFALYRQTHRDGQDLFQKIPLWEHPLLLRLLAGPDPDQLSFVLKENQTGEVEWHAFSVPELQNFLVILEKEEADRVRAVEQRYATYRQNLLKALQQHDT